MILCMALFYCTEVKNLLTGTSKARSLYRPCRKRHVFCKLDTMKYSIILLAAVASLSACNYIAGSTDKAADSTSVNRDAIIPRDESITKETAYSDLFLDSTVIDSFLKENKVPEPVAQGIRNFYNARNLQFAWFSSDGFTEQGRNFWSLYDYATSDSAEGKALNKRMDTLVQKDSLMIAPSDSLFVKTELALTQQFIQYRQQHANADSSVSLQNFIPKKKMDVMELADSILKNADSGHIAQANTAYGLLKDQLRRYSSIARSGGWPVINSGGKSIGKGKSSPLIASIKKRLLLTGDYSGDTTAVFTDSLVSAIKSYQERNGFKPTGVITDSLITVMNVPVEQRMRQLIVNLNRMAWIQNLPAEQNAIEVNIPEFMLHARNTNQPFDMPVIVGKEGANTYSFSGSLGQVVFSPYWNIPRSIVSGEILPAMKSDPNYLKKHHMEVVGKNDSLPDIRQLPGADNALGKVKFLFPNTYDIYLHDTPNKDLFEKNTRAVSHGCIRVANAPKLAQYLLQGQSEWTPEKINAAMNSQKEQTVKITNPVPVHITYYTAWVDSQGKLNFRNDIYGLDEATSRKMFITGG
jgi:murein L,D-transpeptidase YcbB/YkuD